MSPFNTPILPVKKPDGNWRMVCDLRLLNDVVVTRHPVVPNPYTLLGQIPPRHACFSVVDLKDAFWTCPLHKDCRKIFALEWVNPFTGRKQQYQWTVLPQGFIESPNLFGQIFKQLLEAFKVLPGTNLIQYMDDFLVSGEKKDKVKQSPDNLLKFLGENVLRVSKTKLQYVEQEVKYLGHLISESKKKITPETIEGIRTTSLPRIKRYLRKFLGLIGYCRM